MLYKKLSLIFVCALFLSATFLVSACDAEQTDSSAPVTEDVEEPDVAVPALDKDAILQNRFLGDENAPITVTEYSSFTCPHCASFHAGTYKELKAQYIDTGKVKLEFADFPLNLPAMHASLAARCLPDQARYFEFVDALYADQDTWAFVPTYKELLKAKAAEFGLDGATFDACVNDEDLQKALLANMRAAQTKHGVGSTPSFVVNDQELVKGAANIAAFEAAFKKFETTHTE